MARKNALQSPNNELTVEALELIADRFRVLGDASRLKLIRALQSGEKSVTELLAATGLNQANASRHLKRLTLSGILGRKRQGQNAIYYVADKGIFDLCQLVCGSVQSQLYQNAKAFPENSNQ